MLPAGELTCRALDAVEAAIRPGLSTLDLDAIAERTIRDGGGEPNFALVPGYHHTVCASVNDVVVHGMPNDRVLEVGDLVSIDCGALLDGWNGDSARTFLVEGETSDAITPERREAAESLSAACRHAMWTGVAALAKRRHLGEVGADIERDVQAAGPFGILDDYTGHGIGRSMHEEPTVFNYATRGRGPVIKPGLAVCIEPLLTGGGNAVDVDADEWSVRTVDGSLGAHWEHTVLVHGGGIWVSTAPDGGVAGLAPYGVTPTRPQ